MSFGTARHDDGPFPRSRDRRFRRRLGRGLLAAAMAAAVWAVTMVGMRCQIGDSAVRTGASVALDPAAPGSSAVPKGPHSARASTVASSSPRPANPAAPGGTPAARGHAVPLGAFVGSGAAGVERLAEFEQWLNAPVTVGHTYLPGETWKGIEGPGNLVRSWGEWRAADPRRKLVVNVPMLAPNELPLPDDVVSALLRGGATGAFDMHFIRLAERLVDAGAPDTIIVLGWEMNGITYTGRCAPNPEMWKIYWRRIVAAMRSVKGARFQFDFTPSRGMDAIAWPECYPGDDVVDIIGMDVYDQPVGKDFDEFVKEPYGLQAHVDFARAHGKKISFPEWGLFRNSDNPDYIRDMFDWMTRHGAEYQTISDYCPHGVWRCADNPRSSEVYRSLFGRASDLLGSFRAASPAASPNVPRSP